jgi:hypothetical protein
MLLILIRIELKNATLLQQNFNYYSFSMIELQKLKLWYICRYHRHLRKIDWLMERTACFVCLVSTVSGHCKQTF